MDSSQHNFHKQRRWCFRNFQFSLRITISQHLYRFQQPQFQNVLRFRNICIESNNHDFKKSPESKTEDNGTTTLAGSWHMNSIPILRIYHEFIMNSLWFDT